MNLDAKKLLGFQDKLKASLTKRDKHDRLDPKVQRLVDLHVHRMNEGVEFGLRSARHMYAIDRAYDISQHQISPTLVRDLIDKNPTSSAELESLVKSYGLETMFRKVNDMSSLAALGLHVPPGTDPKPGYLLQANTFFNVELPILQSYLKIRWAKLFNDRDLYPLYRYDNLNMSLADRAVAKVTTQRVQRMATEMGYRMTERDSIQKMLLYGQAINFPKEPWYKEEQEIDGKTEIVKEGVRFEIPHPTRVFYDRSHQLYTLNTDTGVEYVGYWNMVRFGDILANDKYWLPDEARANGKKKLKKGERPEGMMLPTGWRGSDGAYASLYRHLYPCTIAFPSAISSQQVFGNDRTNSAFLYNMDSLDAGIDITVMFHKLVPKDFGLYDYAHPVWHRFIYVGGYQLIYCEPVLYTPATVYLYDYDAERARNSSLGFELLPFQDQLGNLLSQQLLTVKKNLMRILAVNRDVVGKDFETKIVNTAENALRGIEVFTYSGQELKDQGVDISQAFYPVPLPFQSAAEVMGSINSLIGILERALGYSSQEVGAPASHQQSAAEVSINAGASTTRMSFTGSFVDDAILARKRCLYYAMLHYSSDKIMAVVQRMSPGSVKVLKERGFEVEENDEEPGLVTVKGTKDKLRFEALFSERDGQNRPSDIQNAQILQSFLDRLMANPAVGQQLPLKYVFKFFNAVADHLGLPEEVKLPEDVEDMNQPDEEQAKAQQTQLQEMIAQIVTQMTGPPLEQISQTVGQLGQQGVESQQVIEQVSQTMAQNDQQIAGRQQTLEQSVQQLMGKIDQLLLAATTPPGGPMA